MYSLLNPARKPTQFGSPYSYLSFVHKLWNWGFTVAAQSFWDICLYNRKQQQFAYIFRHNL